MYETFINNSDINMFQLCYSTRKILKRWTRPRVRDFKEDRKTDWTTRSTFLEECPTFTKSQPLGPKISAETTGSIS